MYGMGLEGSGVSEKAKDTPAQPGATKRWEGTQKRKREETL